MKIEKLLSLLLPMITIFLSSTSISALKPPPELRKSTVSQIAQRIHKEYGMSTLELIQEIPNSYETSKNRAQHFAASTAINIPLTRTKNDRHSQQPNSKAKENINTQTSSNVSEIDIAKTIIEAYRKNKTGNYNWKLIFIHAFGGSINGKSSTTLSKTTNTNFYIGVVTIAEQYIYSISNGKDHENAIKYASIHGKAEMLFARALKLCRVKVKPYTIIKPSNKPNILAKPTGKRTIVHYKKPSSDNIRALIRENEAADILAIQGYVVEQNPKTIGIKNPDYLIEGMIFDCYSPQPETRIKNVYRHIRRKVQSGQTNRIILNLFDWNNNSNDIEALKGQFNEKPINGLIEVKMIDKYCRIINIFPK